jgi:hypothetical protein
MLLNPPKFIIDGQVVSVCPDRHHMYWHVVRQQVLAELAAPLERGNVLLEEAAKEKREREKARKEERARTGNQNETDLVGGQKARGGMCIDVELVEALGALAGRKKAAELEKVEKRKEIEVRKAAKQKADLVAIRAKLVAKQVPTKVEKILLVVLGRRHLGMGEEDLGVLKASMKAAHAQVHIAEFDKLMGELGGSFPWDVFGVSAEGGGGGGGAAAAAASPGDGGGGGDRATTTTTAATSIADNEGNQEDTGRATKRPRNRRTQAEDSDSEEEEEDDDDDDDESGAEESDEDESLDRGSEVGGSDDEEGDEGEDEFLFVGRRVQKDFDKHGVWLGTVMKVDADGIYWVRYDDGDGEELDADEVNDLLIQDESEEGARDIEGGADDKEAEGSESETGSPQKASGTIMEEGE